MSASLARSWSAEVSRHGPVYYNDSDKSICAWLRELMSSGLIPKGTIDARPIQEISPSDLEGFLQCHFFAGIAGWVYALALADWPPNQPVWTGSCPCQPFSAAGQQAGDSDPRHLWPAWFPLIRVSRPPVILGEQVANAIGHGWLDLVSTDLERENYAIGAAVLGACSVGAPHRRQRLYFVADAKHAERRPEHQEHPDAYRRGGSGRGGPIGLLADSGRAELEARVWRMDNQSGADGAPCSSAEPGCSDGLLEHPESLGRLGRPDDTDSGRRERAPGYRGEDGGMADAKHAERRPEHPEHGEAHGGNRPGWSGAAGRMADPGGSRFEGTEPGEPHPQRQIAADFGRGSSDDRAVDFRRPGPLNGFWRDADWIFCRDRKWRPVGPGTFPLVTGAPARMVRLRGYGNSIPPHAAAEVIRAYLEVRAESGDAV